MVVMDLRDVLRDILGAYRVQLLQLRAECETPEAQALDFQFRGQLFENFDYGGFAAGIMDLVPEENVINYKDDFGLHYLVFQGAGYRERVFPVLRPLPLPRKGRSGLSEDDPGARPFRSGH